MTLKAPYPYFGGKSRVAPTVWAALGDVKNYVEPFFGSGAVLLARPSEPKIETVNDADRFVSNFWRAIQADPEGVARVVDWPVNECVPCGTMISTPSGEIPVEEVRAGDVVWGFDGDKVVATVVVATRRSETTDPFHRVGALSLTGNHPVWTRDLGYVDAKDLAPGMTIAKLEEPLNENMGDLRAGRPTNEPCEVCRHHVQAATTPERAFVEGSQGRPNAPRLLAAILTGAKGNADVSATRGGERRRMAGGRAPVDRASCEVDAACESHGWGRRGTRLRTDSGTACEMVKYAKGSEVRTGPNPGDAWQASHGRNSREDRIGWAWACSFGQVARDAIKGPQGQEVVIGAYRKAVSGQTGQNAERRAQVEDLVINDRPQADCMHGDGGHVSVDHRGIARTLCNRGIREPSNPQGLSLQREILETRVARTVFNFQTTTANYFAAGILVHNCDLHARHRWLVNQDEWRERMTVDPDHYDVKIAGWWAWGLCSWIGSEWCRVADSEIPEPDESGVLPHLSNAGQGLHRKLPHLGDAGRGVNRQLPHLGNAGGPVSEWLGELSARLRRVRVACGDWTRVVSEAVTWRHGVTGVFLDPPYDVGEMDYSAGGRGISTAVREWAIANGDNKKMRIALCGYDGEHTMPDSWTTHAWKAHGGYGNAGGGEHNENARRERIWFSPHCLPMEAKQRGLFDSVGAK